MDFIIGSYFIILISPYRMWHYYLHVHVGGNAIFLVSHCKLWCRHFVLANSPSLCTHMYTAYVCVCVCVCGHACRVCVCCYILDNGVLLLRNLNAIYMSACVLRTCNHMYCMCTTHVLHVITCIACALHMYDYHMHCMCYMYTRMHYYYYYY